MNRIWTIWSLSRFNFDTPRNTHAVSQGGGLKCQITQHICWPILATHIWPSWKFSLGCFFFFLIIIYLFYFLFISVFCKLHPELIPVPHQECSIDSVKGNDYPKYILSLVEIWVHKFFFFFPLWSKIYFLSVLKVHFIIIIYCCEKSHFSSLMRQHKMLHGFSCKHYTSTFLVKSRIFPTLSILQG